MVVEPLIIVCLLVTVVFHRLDRVDLKSGDPNRKQHTRGPKRLSVSVRA